MYRFSTKRNERVLLKVDERGVSLLYFAENGHLGEVFQVDHSWPGIHALASRLRKEQDYSAEDDSLSAWKQGDELSIRLHSLDLPLEETFTFSGEMTAKFLDALDRLPNLN